jgi:hypothetical protein
MKLRILYVCLLVVALLGLPFAAGAQSPSAFPYAKPVPNDTATGTTQFTLTKINSSGNAVIMSSADVNGFSGVCVSNCGQSGTAWIVFAGLVPLKVENTATVNHYITIGSSTGGDGHDTGSTSYPASGAVIGRVQTGASAASTAMVDIFGPEIVASSPAAPTITVANAGTTGTTNNTLTKLTGAPSTAVIAATTDTKGVVGITTSGSGTSGNAVIQIAGTVNCVFDGTTTADDYVQISSSTGGDCHDSGPNYPTTGQAIGRVLVTNGSAGTNSIVLFPAEIQAAGTLTASSISVPLGCADSSGSGTAQSCTTSPSITPSADVCIIYTTTTANSGTGLTTNVDSLGAKSIAIAGSSGWTTTLTASVIPANKPLLACYDGTNWDVAQTGTAASGGSGGYVAYGTGGGTAQAQTVTTTPTISSLVTGQTQVCWLPSNANSAGAPTLAVDGLAATTIISNRTGTSLIANDLLTTVWACAIYDGTDFELQNPQSRFYLGSSGGSTQIFSNGNMSLATANGQSLTLGDASVNFLTLDRPGSTTTETAQVCDSGASAQCWIATTGLKATAALTAGEVVKPDSSNAYSVVVSATSDGAGVDIGFVVNSPSSAGIAEIAMPGSMINTPVLGTGTCTLGQFVITDTTTAGRVKCTGTYTAGTVLGVCVTAQSTVGSVVGVLVGNR